MEKNQLTTILQELYDWNPKLRAKESELIKLIKALSEARPDTQFNEQFAAELKKDLLSHRILLDEDEGLEENISLFNFNNMTKKLYFGLGAVALASLVIVVVLINNQANNKSSFVFNGLEENTDQFVQAGPGAFGSLAKLAQGEGASKTAELAQSTPVRDAASDGIMMAQEPNLDAADSRVVSSDSVERPSAASPVSQTLSVPAIGLGGGGIGGDYAKMILPMQSFEYVYTGDALDLSEDKALVYRRLKGDGSLSNKFDGLIGGQKVGPLDLQVFSGLQTNSLAFNENRSFGYSVNIDLREESIYIGQNWPYWQSERDKCGDNVSCWESYRVKIGDVPSNDVLISMADKFLQDKKINRSNYGDPQIDNFWRLNYESSSDKDNYYIPEEISVIYPLMIDGQMVYDQGGSFDGLRVNVNLLHKLVSGVSNLNTARYESSEYSLETDVQKVLEAASKGGSRFYYGDGTEKITLELGTPTKSLIRYWRYTSGLSEELLIPALIFPVKNVPDNYYGSRFITIPLVREMLDELIDDRASQDIGIMPIMPMVR